MALVSGLAGAESSDGQGLLTLSGAYQQALEHAPVISEQRALLEAGDSAVDQAKALRLPNLSVDARYTDSRYETADVRTNPLTGQRERVLTTTNEESYNYGLNLTQPLYDRGVAAGLDEARARRSVAEAQLNATRQELASQVAQAYLRVLRAKTTRDLAESEMQAYRLRWQQMQKRLERDLASRVDVLDAQVRYDRARSDIAEATNELDAARLDLERLTGAYPSQLRAADPMAMPLSETPNDGRIRQWMDDAARQSPIVTVEQQRLQQASEAIAVRQAERFPRFSLEARYSDTDATDQLIQGEDARVLLRLQMPLFTGGGLTAGVDEARAQQRAQAAVLEDSRRQAMIDARAAANELRNTRERIAVSRQALETAEAQVEATERGLDVGLRDLVELLDARAQLFGIRRDLGEAAYDYLIAQVRLETITGHFEPAMLSELDKRYLASMVELVGGDLQL
jgi:outer membrane protein